MRRTGLPMLLAIATLIAPNPTRGADTPPAKVPGVALPIDDFEAEASGWKFVGGEEFPGAKGALARDTTRAHGGKGSYRLDADFRGGGAYVGAWKDLEPLKLPEVAEFRLWVEPKGVDRIGVRIVDGSDQCHQSSVTLPAGSGAGWRPITLKLRDLVGGEHWGGANDGAWHGTAKGIGINLGKDAVAQGANGRASLGIDDLTAVTPESGVPTILSAKVSPASCRPGYGARITYTWDAEPLASNCAVFVHFVNAQGQMVFQGDHDPSVTTTRWSGRVEYGRTTIVPDNMAPGRYDVVIGLWDPRPANRGGGRKPLKAGPGLTALGADSVRVGSLNVASDAPLPVLPPPTLNLADYTLTFDEDFKAPLNISAWGPGTRWIAHTPYGGDFGDAGFGDPEKDSPFRVVDGILRIEAKKVGDKKWRSGLICSVDPKGQGFSQQYGYFEMRAKLPKGLGTWPAFWLMGIPQLVQPKDRKTIPQIEIDVVEQYGVGPNILHTTLHTWGPGDQHWAEGDTTVVTGMTDDFHTYGVSVEPDTIVFYFDGREIRRDPTPKDARVPLYLMVDLALGGGWPTDKTPDPSVMLVDHVRAYARKK